MKILAMVSFALDCWVYCRVKLSDRGWVEQKGILLRKRYANALAKDGLAVELFGVALGLPVLEELVKLAVADALGGLLEGSGGEDEAGRAAAFSQGILSFAKLARSRIRTSPSRCRRCRSRSVCATDG
jgi:hypothetical protein